MHKEVYLSPTQQYVKLGFLPGEAISQQGKRIFTYRTSFGSAQVTDRISEEDQEVWVEGLKHLATNHHYYDLTQASLENQFAHYYLILKDNYGKTRAIQPFLIVKQDMLAGLPIFVQKYIQAIRTRFPNFLKLPMLMVGCSAGEGQVPRDIQTRSEVWVAAALHEALELASRSLKTWMIVFKDFPKLYRNFLEPLRSKGYTRIPSMPGAKMALDFKDFDDYLKTKLSHKTRKNLRKKLRDSQEGSPITMEVVSDITPLIDQLYPLYQAVFQRSKYRFEELTPEYFCQQGKRMKDKSLFFIWYQEGKPIAFCSCLGHEGVLRDNYIGLDYRVALDYHLYFRTWHDTILWAKAHGYHTYYSAPLNYDPKYHLRLELSPLDLYVRFRWNWFNPILRMILPWMEPTRYDPVIHRFANAHELY